METMKKDGNINCEVIMKSHYDTRTNNISDFKTKTMNMLQHTYVITLKFLHIYHWQKFVSHRLQVGTEKWTAWRLFK